TSDVSFCSIRRKERTPHEMRSAQSKEAYRPHSQMLFTGLAKRSLRDTNACANFGEIKWLVWVGRQKILEFRNDRAMSVVSGGSPDAGAFGETSHHDMNQLFF